MSVETALWMMAFMYPVFLAELLTAEGMLVSASKRRPYFWVFLISGIVLLVAVVFAVCCFMTLCNGNAIAGAVGYFLVFLCTLVILRVCFEVPFKVLLFFGTGAYAFQNLCYRLASVLEITGVVGMLGNYIGYGWADFAVHLGLFLVSAVLFWFLFVRKVRRQGMENLYSWNVLLLSLVTLIITIVLCSVTNSYWWMSPQLSLVNYCSAIVGNGFILWIQSGMLERVALKSDIETVRNLWQQDKRQYEIARETIDLINIKCHDMKHKIRALNAGSGLSTEETAEIEKCISIYDAKVSTGCEPIDVLLTEKELICNAAGIRLSCMVDGKPLGYIRDYDLYSLFGNLLSNAIEAVRGIQDEDRRCIDLTVRNCGGITVINCSNYYEGELRLENGIPATSKRDIANHGFGMKSMAMLAQKYGGQLDFSYDGGVFTVNLAFPVKEKALSA